jgi:hypothetical protein
MMPLEDVPSSNVPSPLVADVHDSPEDNDDAAAMMRLADQMGEGDCSVTLSASSALPPPCVICLTSPTTSKPGSYLACVFKHSISPELLQSWKSTSFTEDVKTISLHAIGAMKASFSH